MKNFTNQYSLSKTLRFELEPKNPKSFYQVSDNENDLKGLMEDFIVKYQFVIEGLEKLIFKTQDEKKPLSGEVKIKHCWLRNYTKNQFYEIKDKLSGNQTLIDNNNLKFLKEYFEEWISENRDCIDKLKQFLDQPEEQQERKSEFAYWIKKILKRSNFEAISELFNGNIQNKNSDKNVVLIKGKLDAIKEPLKEIETQLLPSQSLGLEIERASFNYYTVNKKQKFYEKEIEDKANSLSKNYNFKQHEILSFNEVGFNNHNIPLLDLKEAMKKFKADQKSKFYEFVNQKKPYFDLKNDPELKLMDDIKEEEFRKFCAEQDRQKRGKYFQHHFSKYKNFCKKYEAVSKYFGDINNKIKALEKEKIDAERLKSWAVILEKDHQKYILTIPKDANNLRESKKFIDNLQCQENCDWKLHSFESLTLRALSKLCFGTNKNTFIPNIKAELLIANSTFFERQDLKRKDQFSDDGKELIKFYQTVLGLSKTKELLKIENFDGLSEMLGKEYGENQEDFERDLKQACYFKQTKIISEEIKDQLVENYQGKLYKITSYDLQKDDPEILENLEKKDILERKNPEIHTKYWLDFWTKENADQKYNIRLNPEFKINFVQKIDYQLKNPNQPQPRHSRRMKDRYLLSTTIALNALDKNADLAFKKTEEIADFIKK